MTPATLRISVLWLFVTLACALDASKSSATTPRLIRQHGYPVEEHKVQTADGYILTMHRIPYSPKSRNNFCEQRPVAFVMHGFLCASSFWTFNGPGKSLPYILADAGYDVWLGNARGNVYSRKHVLLSPDCQAFWNFGWHEIAIYDTPAMIEYALLLTGQKQVRYFAHSQGTTTFLALNSLYPRYKKHFRSAHLISPVAFVNNSKSALFTLGGALLGDPNPNVEVFGSTEFLPSSRTIELLTYLACKDGASINQYQHVSQLYRSGKFRQFDYGPLRNLRVYGSTEPPDYNLQNIDVPIYVYYCENDYIAELPDLNRLLAELKRARTLKGAYRVPYPKFNHFDLVIGKNVENIVFSRVMEDIANS